jgi:hypothetical protein
MTQTNIEGRDALRERLVMNEWVIRGRTYARTDHFHRAHSVVAVDYEFDRQTFASACTWSLACSGHKNTDDINEMLSWTARPPSLTAC